MIINEIHFYYIPRNTHQIVTTVVKYKIYRFIYLLSINIIIINLRGKHSHDCFEIQ